jgi:hypothetical protein
MQDTVPAEHGNDNSTLNLAACTDQKEAITLAQQPSPTPQELLRRLPIGQEEEKKIKGQSSFLTRSRFLCLSLFLLVFFFIFFCRF